MTTLRPYPQYKPSGIDWLDGIPSHWTSSPLRRVASVAASNVDKHIIEGEIPVSLCNYTDAYHNRHITSDMAFSKGTVSPEELTRFQLLPGDVLITKDSETWDDIAVPAVVMDALPNVVCGYHLSRIRPDPLLDGRFLAYWIGSRDGSIHFKVSANGVTRFGLSANAIKSAPVPLPPLDEQRAIADFLDAMDAKITRFIAARRRMIALLEEQKAAIINQAVTRGLGPDVPLKPSGIDWLGDIPAHWDVLRGSVLFTERNQVGFPELPVLEVSLATGVTIRDLDNQARKQMMSDRAAYKRAAKDDLPYNMMRMWQGAVGVAPVDGLVSPAYVVLQPKPRALSQYFSALFKTASSKQRFGVASRGIVSDRDRLYWESFRQIHFAVPPKDEQNAIANFLDEMQVQITRTKSRAEQEIKLIQEYRTRLISDVVTGKLDVRGGEAATLK